jgi:transposase-like protein
MRQRELVRLFGKLRTLTRSQRQQVLAEMKTADGQAASFEVIEHRAEVLGACPHCQGAHVVKNGRANGLQRFKCRGCGKTFNALTGTPLARLRMKSKWLTQAEALRDGLTIREAAECLCVNTKTALLWRHRFLALPKTVQARALTGIAEADETYFLRSRKGQRLDLDRKARHRGGKAAKRGLSREQVPVLVARDRAGGTADFILPADDAAHISGALGPILAKDAILCSDAAKAMAAAARAMGVAHRPVNLSAGIRIIAGVYHIQNANSYHSRLKEWMRRFKGVATKYLDSYLGWFRTIERSSATNAKSAQWLAMAVMG